MVKSIKSIKYASEMAAKCNILLKYGIYVISTVFSGFVLLTSVMRSVQALMADSGLKEISESTVGRVSTMLSQEKSTKYACPSFSGG